jgi:hypothetical protein
MKHWLYAPLVAALVMFTAGGAYAQCASPSAAAGGFDHDGGTGIQNYCDSSTWTWKNLIEYDASGAGTRLRLQIANDTGGCTAAKLGRIRYNGTSTWEYCNGTTWTALGGGGGGSIDALSDGVADYATDFNLFMGQNAGANPIAGSQYNVAIGQNAFSAVKTNAADSNTALGYNTLRLVTSGSSNTALGVSALENVTTGSSNTAVGHSALYYNDTGEGNAAFGFNAMNYAVSGNDNAAFGRYALYNTSSGSNNAAFGTGALFENSSGLNNVAFGYEALSNNTASNNVAVGSGALDANTSGTPNVAVGTAALGASTTATDNVALGFQAGDALTTGGFNVAVGSHALGAGTTAENNVAVGYNALLVSTSDAGVAVGSEALKANTSGSGNVAVGMGALTANTTGGGNVALGGSALVSSTIAMFNTAVGGAALAAVTSGGSNIAVGYAAGANITTGASNITVGTSINAVSATASNQLNIGNTIYGDMASDYIGIGQTAPSAALDVLGDIEYTGVITDVSDRRLKDGVRPLSDRGSMIEKLRALPAFSFFMKDDPKKRTEFGVMAQDLQAVFPELVTADANSKEGYLSANYVGLIGPIIGALQEQQTLIEQQQAVMSRQQAQIDQLLRMNGQTPDAHPAHRAVPPSRPSSSRFND